ncbi:hypothetical protein RQP46_005987 [Phenoliferia psychrophenolica]
MDTSFLATEAPAWPQVEYTYSEEAISTSYWSGPEYVGVEQCYPAPPQEFDPYSNGYPPTPSSSGPPSATFPSIHTSSKSYVYDDSAPSSAAFSNSSYDINSPIPYESNSPSLRQNRSDSWFAIEQDSFLAAAPALQYSAFPPSPQLTYSPQSGSQFSELPYSPALPCWSDSHPPPATHRASETSFAPTSAAARYASARNLFIVVPPSQSYSTRSSISDAVLSPDSHSGYYSTQLGSPFQYQTGLECGEPSEYAFAAPASAQYYPSNPAALYPSPTPAGLSNFDSHVGAFSSPVSPSFPNLVSPSRPTRVVAQEPYHPPSPPPTPSLSSAAFPHAHTSPTPQPSRPFPSVLARSLPMEQTDLETLGTSESPTKATPPKTPKKRVRPSRAKPKNGPNAGEAKPLRFINFTQKDSRALVSAVAPSGPLRASTKRKPSASS